MTEITSTIPPSNSLLHLATRESGAYADCFETSVPLDASIEHAFERFVFLLFDSHLFRVELGLLRLAGKAPRDRSDPVALAKGHADQFATWRVEARRARELLLTVPTTPILTWLAVEADDKKARLQFGSGILPQEGKQQPHLGFRATIKAHRLYSRLLIQAAATDWRRGKDLPV